MSEPKPVAITAASIQPRRGTSYPPPFDAPCAAREKHALGDAFGLTDYGVNQVTLPPGTASSQRHWHSQEDEFVYILAGNPTLVTDSGRTLLRPGMCAGFPAGSGDGHHLLNETDDDVSYLEVGSRRLDDDVEYSDIDMRIVGRGRGDGFLHKDGTPYA
ncbi:MAG: cupin domain-containing protein [Gammaproteobacteria bacterium]|nr:cupin domain-containing protein [Gammaproteobacteria bacterium]